MNYQDMEPLVLERVPEIRKEYYEMGIGECEFPTENNISKLYKIAEGDHRRIGATIIFENALYPFIAYLANHENKGCRERLQEIMDMMENWASPNNQFIRNSLIGVCFCERILGDKNVFMILHSSYFGINLKSLCKEILPSMNYDLEVRAIVNGWTDE